MRHLFLVCLFFCASVSNALAQAPDVVELHSGLRLEGKIIKTNYPDSLLLRLRGGNVVQIGFTDIKSIVGVNYFNLNVEPEYFERKLVGGLGFGLVTDVRWVLGNVDFHYRGTIAYQVFPKFEAGLGAAHFHHWQGLDIMPIFAEAKYHFTDRIRAPYVYSALGYGLPTRSNDFIFDEKGGYFIELGIGRKRFIAPNAAYFVQLGYSSQKVTFKENEGWWWGGGNRVRTVFTTFDKVALTTGISF